MRIRKAVLVLFIFFIIRLDAKLNVISGTLDLSFGGNGTGFRLLNLAGGNDNAQAVVLDKLGRIVCAGVGALGSDLAIVRFTPDGILDLTFGGTGSGFRLLNMGGTDFARALVLDSQERIVCAGRGGPPPEDIAIARFTSDGDLDLTFGGTGTGFRLLNLGGTDRAQAMVLDDQERIICAGQGGVGLDIAIVRFTSDGILDLTFGGTGTGFRLLDLGGIDRAEAMALDSQGRIICAGRGGPGANFAVVRFTSDGILDLTFGGNGTGFRLLDLGGTDNAEAMALDSQGRIVCAGRGGPGGDLALARFTSEGLVDTSFGGNGTGFSLLDLGGADDRAEAMKLDLRGRIVCSGQGGGDDIAIARFTPDGIPDFSFGGNGTGFRLFDLGGGNDRGRALVLDSQGRIVVAGQGGSGSDLSVARFFGEILQNCTLALREKYCVLLR